MRCAAPASPLLMLKVLPASAATTTKTTKKRTKKKKKKTITIASAMASMGSAAIQVAGQRAGDVYREGLSGQRLIDACGNNS